MQVTFKSKLELRIIVKSYNYKKVVEILKNNNLEHLCFFDENNKLHVITVLEVLVLKIPILYKLLKDDKIENFA